MEFLKPLYITFIGIAFLVSLISFKWNFPFHLRFFSALLGLTLLVELVAVYGLKEFKLGQYRNGLYNCFMLVEFSAYAYFFRQILTKWKFIPTIFLVALPVCWLISNLLTKDINKWNSLFSVIGASCTIFMVVTYYAELLTSTEPVRLLKQPEFIIATAMLVFYTCTLPYLGPLNYLNERFIISSKTFLSVLRILNIIMYSLFSYAFICQRTIRK